MRRKLTALMLLLLLAAAAPAVALSADQVALERPRSWIAKAWVEVLSLFGLAEEEPTPPTDPAQGPPPEDPETDHGPSADPDG